MQNSPHHKLTRWLVDALDPIREVLTPHYVKDCFEFANTLDISMALHKMFSIDVNSLLRMCLFTKQLIIYAILSFDQAFQSPFPLIICENLLYYMPIIMDLTSKAPLYRRSIMR